MLSRRAVVTVAIAALVVGGLVALAVLGAGSEAPREEVPVQVEDRSPAQEPGLALAEQQAANARLAPRPCELLGTADRERLGLPGGPGEPSVDFVAARCTWTTPAGALALAVGVDPQVVDAWDEPAAEPLRVAGTRRAVRVAHPVLQADGDEAGGGRTVAVIADAGGRLVVLELAGATDDGADEVDASLHRATALVVGALPP